MANEISVSVAIQARKGKVTAAMSTGGIALDMSGDNMIAHVQNVGASAEALALSDVSGAQILALRHAGSSGTVDVSLQSDGSSPFAALAADGPPVVLPTPAAAIYLKASTGTIPVEVVAAEA